MTSAKAPELSNPMDPASKPTGNTVFILSEVYETGAGVADHFKVSERLEGLPGPRRVARKVQGHGAPGRHDHQLALVRPAPDFLTP